MLLQAELAVLALEAFDAPCRIHQALCPGVKGMASRAHFDVNLGHSRMRFEGVAACARDDTPAVLRMSSGFHCLLSFFVRQSIKLPSRHRTDNWVLKRNHDYGPRKA